MIIYNVENPGCHKPTYHDWGWFTYRSHKFMGLGDGDYGYGSQGSLVQCQSDSTERTTSQILLVHQKGNGRVFQRHIADIHLSISILLSYVLSIFWVVIVPSCIIIPQKVIWTLHDEFGCYPTPAHPGDTPKTTKNNNWGLKTTMPLCCKTIFSTSLRSCLTPQNGENLGKITLFNSDCCLHTSFMLDLPNKIQHQKTIKKHQADISWWLMFHSLKLLIFHFSRIVDGW